MASSTWVLDPTHSEVQFKVKHLVISTVTGSFKQFAGEIHAPNESSFEGAQVRFTAEIASIDTNQEQRDQHLKSGEFFDAAAFPQLIFESNSMRRTGDEDYELSGNLTLHGVTKPITLQVSYGGSATDFYGNRKAGFEVTGKLSRKEYDLTWDGITEAGAIVVGDEVKLFANVQFAQQVAATA